MINLKEVITKYPECLVSSEKLKAYLTDLYPDEKAKVSIIVAISNSGIAEEIKKSHIYYVFYSDYISGRPVCLLRSALFAYVPIAVCEQI